MRLVARGARWLLAALLLGCAMSAAQAQKVVDAPTTDRRVMLSRSMEFFVDETGQWRPGSGTTAPAPTWRPYHERAGRDRFGFYPHPLWLRSVLHAPAQGEWVWSLPRGQWDHVTWVVEHKGLVLSRTEGGLGPIENGTVPAHRQPAFVLPLSEGQTITLYTRLETQGRLRVNAYLQEVSAWRQHEGSHQMWLGVYFGLLAGLLIYNSFLALRLRDPAYVYYIAFGASMAVFQLCTTGFGPNLLWPQHALLTYPLLSVSSMAMMMSGLLFANSFLRVWRFSRGLSWVLQSLALFWLLLILVSLLIMGKQLPPWDWPLQTPVPLGLITLSLILGSGVWGWLKGAWAAGIFLLAWSGMVASMFARTLTSMGLMPATDLSYNALYYTSAAEMLLLSLALADRITSERHARTEADLQRAREQAAREQAQQALQEKSRFMAAVTHDLQQPLYALSLATESVARQGVDRMPPQALTQIRSAVHTADELLASLAMNVRLERAELQPEFDDFSVQDMLERIEVLFDARAQQAGLRWRVLPSMATVRSDPVMLERMLCNLVSNALRYTHRGGALLSARERGEHLLIQVWDTGPGIAENERSSIFEAYQRGDAARSHDKGLGLGLSIVHRCARLLGIRVDLRSVPGRGSCFALWVPLAWPRRRH